MKKIILVSIALVFSLMLWSDFAETNIELVGFQYSSQGDANWGDFDNDHDLDLLLGSTLYRNDENFFFTNINAGLEGQINKSVEWGDYDNDGDLDILMTANVSMGNNYYYTKIYRNNGDGTFTDIWANLPGLSNANAVWGDYDNDCDLDILLTGTANINGNSVLISRIYRNNGNNTFTDINAGLLGVYEGSVAWGDLDNDGDLDIILSGFSPAESVFKIYRNDGNNVFTDIGNDLQGTSSRTISLGDYDNDGDLDILLTGNSTIILRNDGNFSFLYINTGFNSVQYGSASWGDYDNDGDLDILLTGIPDYSGNPYNAISRVYRNNGNGTFTDINAGLLGVYSGAVAWGDYDNDGDLDIFLNGNEGNHDQAKIYRNNGSSLDTKPLPPSNLRSSIHDEYVIFQWDASSDTQTPSVGLNYSLRIGSTPCGSDILSSISDSLGHRLMPARGYTNSNCSWKIKTTALPDSCYWGVQAIDTAFMGSEFAISQYFNDPRLTLLTNPSIQFGNVPINDSSDEVEIKIKNTGSQDIIISSIHFSELESQFGYFCPILSYTILPGDTDTIFVHFSPMTVGAVVDTLFIESNVVNKPILTIRLTGTGIEVPPKKPVNLVINRSGNNILLNWDAVTEDIHNNPITPDGYLIFHNGSNPDNEDDYFYLWEVPGITFMHYHVAEWSPFMFYRIKAFKIYSLEPIEDFHLMVGMTEKEVSRRLGSNE
jgi:hypothetical protein